jgi:hypothetical protein
LSSQILTFIYRVAYVQLLGPLGPTPLMMKLFCLSPLFLALTACVNSLAVAKRKASPGVISFDLHKNPKIQHAPLRKRAGTIELPDINYVTGLLYIVEIWLGTPPQPNYVQLDTASSDLVIETNSSDICTATVSNPCTDLGSCK